MSAARAWAAVAGLVATSACTPAQQDHDKSGPVPLATPAPSVVHTHPPRDTASGTPAGALHLQESMVLIPPATFDMGEKGHVEPVTRVTLPAYYLDRTEVPVADYEACVRQGRCTTDELTSCGPQSNWGHAGRSDHPMNCVAWEQARAFCAARGARLPTEAEWELGARGTDGRPYPWGSAPPTTDLAQFHVNAQGPLSTEGVRTNPTAFTTSSSQDLGTSPVDSHAAGASPFGLLNMAGNVWEWVEDTFGPYPGGSVSGPRPAEEGAERVVRGGGYSSVNAAGLRTFDRDSAPPGKRGRNLGFRCARSGAR